MENIRNTIQLVDVGDHARRQYIDATSTYSAWEEARLRRADVRGGMYWKQRNGTEYLIRTALNNSQKSLGPKSPETEEIYRKFFERKKSAEERYRQLCEAMTVQQRLNRALMVGRAPKILVDILAALRDAGVDKYFTVIGTHALYAYEAAAGVRIESQAALATRDVDLLWDTRRRFQFWTQMDSLGFSMIHLLKKVDSTFEVRNEQLYTAVNGQGFEVDIIRREPIDGDPHPLQLTRDEADLWAVQAKRAGSLLSGRPFSSIVVSASGHMTRMNTISPSVFADFKRWMAAQPTRDPMKIQRDLLQANIVEQLAEEYLPHLGLG